MRGTVLCVVLLASALPLCAQDDTRLFVRPWVELEPVVRIDAGEYPIPPAVAERKVLEEARVLLSGMVYGWSFDYTPANHARAVSESFSLTPVAQIPWGSPRLRVIETGDVRGEVLGQGELFHEWRGERPAHVLGQQPGASCRGGREGGRDERPGCQGPLFPGRRSGRHPPRAPRSVPRRAAADHRGHRSLGRSALDGRLGRVPHRREGQNAGAGSRSL